MISIAHQASADHYTMLKGLIENLTRVFLYVSGPELIALGKELLEQEQLEKSRYNLVFRLDTIPTGMAEQCNPEAEVVLHPTDQTSFLKVKKYFNYNEEKWQELPTTQVVLEFDGELVAGARSNQEVDEFALVGGVGTNPNYRKQKLGFTVCYHLISHLAQNYEVVALETDVDNFPAIKIYEKLGFDIVGQSAFFEKGLEQIDSITGDRDY